MQVEGEAGGFSKLFARQCSCFDILILLYALPEGQSCDTVREDPCRTDHSSVESSQSLSSNGVRQGSSGPGIPLERTGAFVRLAIPEMIFFGWMQPPDSYSIPSGGVGCLYLWNSIQIPSAERAHRSGGALT